MVVSALQLAKLVSPENCNYFHLTDHAEQKNYYGKVKSIVSRHFWIHQNFELAKLNLEFLAPFLVPKGQIYADFFLPSSNDRKNPFFPPEQKLMLKYPSALFSFTLSDIEKLLEKSPFSYIRHEDVPSRNIRYVVIEKK